jgi:hypothetical protein
MSITIKATCDFFTSCMGSVLSSGPWWRQNLALSRKMILPFRELLFLRFIYIYKEELAEVPDIVQDNLIVYI